MGWGATAIPEPEGRICNAKMLRLPSNVSRQNDDSSPVSLGGAGVC